MTTITTTPDSECRPAFATPFPVCTLARNPGNRLARELAERNGPQREPLPTLRGAVAGFGRPVPLWAAERAARAIDDALALGLYDVDGPGVLGAFPGLSI